MVVLAFALLGFGCVEYQTPPLMGISEPTCERVVTANVVALEQAYTYNRFDAYNPAGMLFALRHDVVDSITGLPLADVRSAANDPAKGHVRLRSDKRPRPLVLRVNEGDCLRVTFTNLLSETAPTFPHVMKNPATGDQFKTGAGHDVGPLSPEHPFTRHASIHVNGLYYAGNIGSDGANVGMNASSLAAPGETKVYTWYAKAEGTYFMYSMGTIGGGEGDGGQLGLGLFGAVNVEPSGATWYRSQISAQDMQYAAKYRSSAIGTPVLDYEPLRILSASNEILHSDLNAVIDNTSLPYENGRPRPGARGEDCGADLKKLGIGSSCGKPFREFTVIFHDEITADQAFPELTVEGSPLEVLKDNMAINYGAAGVGSLVLANRKGIGPSRKCKECKLEEFFLTSWVNGDPALVLAPIKDGQGNPVPLIENGLPVKDIDGNIQYRKRALYPDDPSNVHHSYVGDPVRFRNIHAGPKETHVFHLHAHQWVQDKHDPNSVYLDSQTISPGTAFNYEVHYGGSGNRNLGPGDSIFHCHLYPHFAQGMWELWRAHDVFEDGTLGLFDPLQPISATNSPRMRNLPDAEIAEGTPTPALVPLPRQPLLPMPTPTFPGYPFYVAGTVGHRPPQPPNDFDQAGPNRPNNGGLPRHIISEATTKDEFEAAKHFVDSDPSAGVPECRRTHEFDLAEQSRKQSDCIAKRTHRLNSDPLLTSMARELVSAKVTTLAPFMPQEETARDFHAGRLLIHGHSAVSTPTPFGWQSKAYPTCDSSGKCDSAIDPGAQDRVLIPVNGQGDQPGAPFGNPCPKYEFEDDIRVRTYRGAYIQLDMTVNKQGWHDPQARIAVLEEDIRPTLTRKRPAEPLFFRANSGDCVVFKSTNLLPSILNLDDFQVFSPTDTIGQHIHLVKFDVTSSDGSGNGWNYEDGTFSPDEVRERLHAHNEYVKAHGGSPMMPQTHPLFMSDGAMKGDARGICPTSTDKKEWDLHPWCGAQTTVQRWWVDPLLNHEGEDRTLRTVFTHDHFGPSSHQQHGLYAALVVEPKGSEWRKLDGSPMGGSVQDGSPRKEIDGRRDGGPTSFAALITESKDPKREDVREYNLAVADFAIVYNEDNWPVNPDHRREEVNLPSPRVRLMKPNPQGISPSDPGTALFNYRNEPIPLRIGEKQENPNPFEAQYKQKKDRADTDKRSRCRAATVDNAHDEFEKARAQYPKPISADAVKKIEQAQDYCDGDLAYVFNSVVHGDQHADGEFLFLETSPSLGGSQLTNTLMRGSSDPQTNISQPPLRTTGDPATPLLFAYQGERVNIRLIQGAQESQHVFNMHGVKWHAQPDSLRSGWTNAQQLGISEHFEFDLHLDKDETTDFLYSSPEVGNLWHGAWGILRGYKRGAKIGPNQTKLEWDGLPRLRDSSTSRPSADSNHVCEIDDSKEDDHAVTVGAWLAKDILPKHKLTYNSFFQLTDPNAILFVDMTREVTAYRKVSQELRSQSVEKNQKDDREKLLELLLEEMGTSSPDYKALSGETISHVNFNHSGWPLQLMLKESYKSGARTPEPLILRVAAGDCLKVTLENHLPHEIKDGPPITERRIQEADVRESWSFNEMPGIVQGFNFNQFKMSNRVSLHAALVEMNTRGQDGAAIGLNLDSTVAPGKSKTYEWYAGEFRKAVQGKREAVPIEFGAVPLRDMGDVIKHSSHGAIGALIIEPKGATWTSDPGTEASATVRYINAAGTEETFREFVLLYQDDVSLRLSGDAVVNREGVDDVYDLGQKAFNYRTEPLWARLGLNPGVDLETLNQVDHSNVLSSKVTHSGCTQVPCDPATPFFIAKAGDPIRFRVVNPSGHSRQHGFTLHGHEWAMAPWGCGEENNASCNSSVQAEPLHTTNRIGSVGGLGPTRHVNILTTAGGPAKIPGDYLYRTQESFQFDSGLWGILCVYDANDTQQCHDRSAAHSKRSIQVP